MIEIAWDRDESIVGYSKYYHRVRVGMSFSDTQNESSAPLPRGLEGHLVLAMAQEAFRDFSFVLFCFPQNA